MKKIIFPIIVLIIICVISGGVYLMLNRNKNIKLVDLVSRHMTLPNEVPTEATVSDKSKLVGQKFFEKSENGDKVLMFYNAGKAILYRPSIDRIIETGPIIISDNSVPETSGIKNNVRVVVLNGSGETGLATSFSEKILTGIENLSVVEKAVAKNKYQQTAVVILNEKVKDLATGLAEGLKVKITEMPASEIKPETDVVIILGKNHP